METWPKAATTAERLKQAMDEAQMKQADLAKATGLSKGGISNYVLGRYEPKSDVINKLAKALNCSEMWLWGYDVPKERQKKISFDEGQLTEGKRLVLELFDQIPEEEQIQLVQTIKAFRQIPEDHQKLVNQMIRAAVNNQK